MADDDDDDVSPQELAQMSEQILSQRFEDDPGNDVTDVERTRRREAVVRAVIRSGEDDLKLKVILYQAVAALITVRGLALDTLAVAVEQDAEKRAADVATALSAIRESTDAMDQLIKSLSEWPSQRT